MLVICYTMKVCACNQDTLGSWASESAAIIVFPKMNDVPYLSLGKTRQMHLLIKEIYHFLFGESKWNISNINPPGLSSDGRPNHGDSCLGRIWHQCCRDLTTLLHALVLHGCYVLKPWWGHIPVQRGLPPFRCLFAISIPGSWPIEKIVMVSS